MKLHSSIIKNLWQKILEWLIIWFIKLLGKKQDEKVGQSQNSGVAKFFYKKILFVRIDRIGDMLLLTPAIRAIKKFYKEANIYVLATDYNKDVLLHNENIHEIFVYEKNLFKKIKIIKKLKEYKFDIAIDSYSGFNIESATITYLSSAKIRLGYNSKNAKYFFNRIADINISKYEALKHLDLLKAAGVYDNDISLELNCSKEDEKKTRDFVSAVCSAPHAQFIGINPGARRSVHLWKPEKFAELADLLIRKYKVSIIITWGPGELKLAESIKNKMTEKATISYKTNILELSALISKFQLFICSDTGPFHVAVSQKIPIVALFGKGDYLRWSPPYIDNIRTIKGKKVKDISVEEVLCEVEYILNQK